MSHIVSYALPFPRLLATDPVPFWPLRTPCIIFVCRVLCHFCAGAWLTAGVLVALFRSALRKQFLNCAYKRESTEK